MLNLKNQRNWRTWLSLLLVTLALLPQRVHSQDPNPSPTPSPTPDTPTVNKPELHQALLDLSNPWTVMCVAAHPDDEDGTTLTVLRRKFGVHTVSLFSTFGEGGQNAIGPELYEELGVMRAEETRRAARIQGSEPYFLGLKDFGFSKSADEAFKFWGHDEALRRMVLKIRQLRPDVIITNHDTVSGHGHHQATGRLVLEAFDAAADEKKFPEQLNGVTPWQVKRLFVRARRSPNDTQTADDKTVVIDPNEIDQLRGTMYGEQSLLALQQHATQGPWPKSVSDWLRAQNNQTGKLNVIRYRLVKSTSDAATLSPDASLPTFLGGLTLAPDFDSLSKAPRTLAAEVTKEPVDYEKILDGLIDWSTAFAKVSATLSDRARATLLQTRHDRALAVAASVSLALNPTNKVLVPGGSTKINVNLSNSGTRRVIVRSLRLISPSDNKRLDTAEQLLPDTDTTDSADVWTPANAPLTVPKAKHLYDELEQGRRVDAVAELELEGAKFKATASENLDVAPAVEFTNVSPDPYVRTVGTLQKPLSFTVTVQNHLLEKVDGFVKVASPVMRVFEFGKQVSLQPNESSTVTLELNAIPKRTLRATEKTQARLSFERAEPRNVITERWIDFVYSNAIVRKNRRVAYIPSFDRTLELSLAALGVDAQSLSAEDIKTKELSLFNTIIIDNRGYEAHPELIANNDRLLNFVKAGGTLIVFYHKDNEWNPDERRGRPQLAPYPIILNDARVTEEDAPIKFLLPGHRLLNWPNRITQTDFANWVQERGLYYPKEWDNHYAVLFASNDTGEKPLLGGLLVAKYGKGSYIYTSMVWYRQLRAGLPGSYRMLANLVSY